LHSRGLVAGAQAGYMSADCLQALAVPCFCHAFDLWLKGV
jgi:hypothetical protein